MAEVQLRWSIYSSADERPGSWELRRPATLAAVPRAGDRVEPADGWASVDVRATTFTLDGGAHVWLRSTRTDDPELLAELDRLVAEHGWSRV